MEIQKIFSSYDDYGYEDERIYSVLMDEDEIRIFSYYQKEFGRRSERRKKQQAQRYADARTPKGMTSALVVSPESQGRGRINVGSARQAAIEGAVPTQAIKTGEAVRPIISVQAAEGKVYEKGSKEAMDQTRRTRENMKNHGRPVASRNRGYTGDVKADREIENEITRKTNQERYRKKVNEKLRNDNKELLQREVGYKDQISRLGNEAAGYKDQISRLGNEAAGYKDQISRLGNEAAGYKEQISRLGNEAAGYKEQINKLTNSLSGEKNAAKEAAVKAAKKLRNNRLLGGLAVAGVGTGAYLYGRNRSNKQ